MKILITALLLLGAPLAFGGDELDNEKSITNVQARIKDLPQTLIMRKNEKTGTVEVAHLKNSLSETQLTKEEIDKLVFTEVAADKIVRQSEFGELDADNSRVSWYFYWGYTGYCCSYGYGYAYYPYYNYYGYSYAYTPYYNYGWGGYYYNYYRPYYYGYYW